MHWGNDVDFTEKAARVMHIDFNSCFASVEQQANPRLRGKPIAVAAYTTDNGCILAASREAKVLGIKTGMRVKEGREKCSQLVVVPTDPDKYRFVHKKLKRILNDYCIEVYPKSIDEFVLNLDGYPGVEQGLMKVAQEIKLRIKEEIGEWLTVSIGIGPNRFLAKTAAGIKKPDGLEEINKDNFLEVYSRLELIELCGVGSANRARLVSEGINTVIDLWNSDRKTLERAFGGVVGLYWYLKLRGFEVEGKETNRKSLSQIYSLPRQLQTWEQVEPIVFRLVEKMASRLRRGKLLANGVSLDFGIRQGHWGRGKKLMRPVGKTEEIYEEIKELSKGVKKDWEFKRVSVGCFNLVKNEGKQLNLFEEKVEVNELTLVIDRINQKWGGRSLTWGKSLGIRKGIPDAIGFGQVDRF